MIDFETLEPPKTDNFYLVCPEGVCRPGSAQDEAPVFPVAPAVLRELWLKILSQEPRITMVSWNDDRLECEFVQRSALFKLPDRISIRFFHRRAGQSTLAVYSRSLFGRYDLGANKRRIERWLAALDRDVARVAGPKPAPSN